MVDGFKDEVLNTKKQDENEEYFGMRKSIMGISEIQMMNIKTSAQQEFGLLPDEMELVREFFDEEIRGRDAQEVLKIYQILLKDIGNRKLRAILIEKISKFKGNDFAFFQ